jgi:hypothetical protein
MFKYLTESFAEQLIFGDDTGVSYYEQAGTGTRDV